MGTYILGKRALRESLFNAEYQYIMLICIGTQYYKQYNIVCWDFYLDSFILIIPFELVKQSIGVYVQIF